MRDEERSPADDADAPAPKQSIGETLRATRQLRRASIEYVSDLLRIEAKFVAALEEERFDAIGPPVFVKGYLKHYAELLGLDPRPLLDELRQRLGSAEPPLQARHSAERGEPRSRFAAVAIGAAVIALAALAVWQLGGLGFIGGSAGPDAAFAGASSSPGAVVANASPPAANAAVPGASSPATNAAGGASSASSTNQGGTAAQAAAGTSQTPEPTPVTGARPAAADPGSPAAGASTAPSATAAADGSSTAETTSRLEIGLRFVEDSWTEVTSAGGERLFYGLGRAGLEERIRADDEVRVLLGNADGVVVSVNGRPFAYPSGSRSGDLARFRLSPDN